MGKVCGLWWTVDFDVSEESKTPRDFSIATSSGFALAQPCRVHI